MMFLIFLLAGLALLLPLTFRIYRNPRLRGYLVMLLILDAWLLFVLGYLLISAAFDLH